MLSEPLLGTSDINSSSVEPSTREIYPEPWILVKFLVIGDDTPKIFYDMQSLETFLIQVHQEVFPRIDNQNFHETKNSEEPILPRTPERRSLDPNASIDLTLSHSSDKLKTPTKAGITPSKALQRALVTAQLLKSKTRFLAANLPPSEVLHNDESHWVFTNKELSQLGRLEDNVWVWEDPALPLILDLTLCLNRHEPSDEATKNDTVRNQWLELVTTCNFIQWKLAYTDRPDAYKNGMDEQISYTQKIHQAIQNSLANYPDLRELYQKHSDAWPQIEVTESGFQPTRLKF